MCSAQTRLHGGYHFAGKEAMVIREATVADLNAIMHHRRGMFLDMGFCDEADLAAMEATSGPVIKAGLEDGSYRGWLIEENGNVVAGGGLVIVGYPSAPHNPLPKRVWILNMYTEPRHRLRGYAKAIIETIVAWCRAEGYASVSLHASDAGRHLYEMLGFTPTSEMHLVLR
jgi:GNAT superfamily N-acetyltransferase